MYIKTHDDPLDELSGGQQETKSLWTLIIAIKPIVMATNSGQLQMVPGNIGHDLMIHNDGGYTDPVDCWQHMKIIAEPYLSPAIVGSYR